MKVRPTESQVLLKNPHKGIATFMRFNGDEPRAMPWILTGMKPVPVELLQRPLQYLPSTVAYFRWFWLKLQPEENRFDWSRMDAALAGAISHGQTLQVRLMPHGLCQPVDEPEDVDSLPEWYLSKYPVAEAVRYGRPYTIPIYDSPEYIAKWTDLIRAFGQRYDGHPGLESVDVAFLGAWGEGGGQAREETITKITEAYREAHPRTPLVTMIGGTKMVAGLRAGAGWRCDCFGDLRQWNNPDVSPGIGEKWNHMFDRYPMAVCECGALDVWQRRPVILETCATPVAWLGNGFDLDFIFQQGLKYHGSFFMPHGAALPKPWLERLAQFCDDLGYRFVFRQFQIESPLRIGSGTEFTVWIENIGVAPIYRQYEFVLRFRQGERIHLHRSARDIRQWLPGDTFLRESVHLPVEFKPGHIEVAAGLVDAGEQQPRVRFAVKETDAAGWVQLGNIDAAC